MRGGFPVLFAMTLVAALPAAAGAAAPLDVDPANPPAGYESPHCTPTPGTGDYPAEARRKHEEGDGVVRYVVDTDGHVRDAAIEKSTGFALLDDAALGIVRGFRCTPGMLNGKAIAVRLPFDEHWSLKGITSEPLAPSATNAGITPPVALTSHAATEDDYPPLARARHEEGKTLVYYVVNADGSVGAARVEKSSGFADLDAASIEMVKTWRFKPATKDGKPLAVSNRVYVGWKLTAPDVNTSPYFTTVIMTAGDYPASAKAANEEGTALISVFINENGQIAETKIMVSSGFADLDEATQDLVRTRWHFTPGTFNGKPTGSVISVVVVWTLKPQDPPKAKE